MARKKSKKSSAKSNDAHGKKDISADLAELNAIWGDTEPVSFDDVADGKYQIAFTEITINRSKASERLQVTFKMKIASGDFANRALFKHDGIDNQESLGYFKGGMARLGVECPDDMTELPDLLEELVGTYAAVTVKTKKNSDMANIYFDKALDSDDIDDIPEEDVEEAAADESEEALEWSKGEKCQVNIDDTMYPGVVQKVNDDGTADIKFEDGDEDAYALEDLVEVEGEEEDAAEEVEPEPEAEEEAEEDAWKKGDECQVDIDGTMYTGKITKIKDETATVKFEDGDVDDYALEDLLSSSDEEEEAATEDDGKLVLGFTEADISEKEQKVVEKLSKDHEFNPDDYDTYLELLQDMGEYLDITGNFDSAKAIIDAVETSA